VSSRLPFETFLEVLRSKGYSVTLHEHFAVAKLLERWDRTDVTELRDALAALIARNDDEVESIRALFDELHEHPPVARAPSAAREIEPRWSFSWTWAAVVAAVFGLAALIASQVWPVRLPSLPGPPVIPVADAIRPIPVSTDPDTSPPPVVPIRRRPTVAAQTPPAPGLPDPPSRIVGSAVVQAATVSFLMVFASLWRVKSQSLTRRWLDRAWRSALAALPGPFQQGFVVRGLTWRLPRLDLEDAAMILGRIYGTDVRARELDVQESLRLTLRHGLLPHLVYKRVRAARPVVVLEDVSYDMEPWREKVRALLSDLRRQGILLEQWYFDGDPRRVSEKPRGALTPLASLLGRRADAPVLVVSTGAGLASVFDDPDTSWLQVLRQCPRRTWITPLADRRLWSESLSRVPIAVWPMTRQGLTQAARELAGFDTPQRVRARVLSEVRVTQDDVERLKRLGSLVPHPTIELLELLRRRFAPEIPDSAVAYLFRESGSEGLRVLRLTDEEVQRSAAALRRDSPRLEGAVRREILAVLRDSAPPPGSAAHLRWQLAEALQEVSLAQLQGTDARAPLATLEALGRGPLWEEVASAVRLLPDARDVAGSRYGRLAAAVRAGRRPGPPPDDGELERWAPRPRPRPGLREFVTALACAAVLCLAAWQLGVFPARTLAHVENAYRLTFLSGADGASRQLDLRVSEGPYPRTVALYRNDEVFQQALTIPPGMPLLVDLPPAAAGSYYQARITLPGGNLAVSNAVWVPPANLLVVLIDAQPWARVVIDGAGTHLEPGTTPFSIPLAPGVYDLQLENGGLTPPRQETIQVAPGNQEFRFVMPGYDPARAAEQLLGGAAP
jgi:hypothetical protein